MNDKNAKKHVPGYDSDALSEILQLLKLDVNIYHNAKVCGNWKIAEHTLGVTCFHIVTVGSCVLDVPGHINDILLRGDLVIFPKELPHTMVPEKALTGKQQHLAFKDAQHMDGTGLLCGEVRFQHQGSRYLLAALPPVFVIRHTEANQWLKSLLTMILSENMEIGPASKVIFDRLSELLFTYALRQYIAEHPREVGMLAIYGHARIAKVVNAIHRNPDKSWSLLMMAKQAALSRTSFAETFKAISGWTAGQYLSWWRMQLAWTLLRNGESVTQVAAQVGYHSESSFSRAFQKMFSVSAGKVRRGLSN